MIHVKTEVGQECKGRICRSGGYSAAALIDNQEIADFVAPENWNENITFAKVPVDFG